MVMMMMMMIFYKDAPFTKSGWDIMLTVEMQISCYLMYRMFKCIPKPRSLNMESIYMQNDLPYIHIYLMMMI